MIPFEAILEAALSWLWDLQEGFGKAYDSICHLVFQSWGPSRQDKHIVTNNKKGYIERADMFFLVGVFIDVI